ncbi:hypothetical protein GQ457_09G017460 [Hibiscus cannabinus]
MSMLILFYLGASIICLSWMTKGMSRPETTVRPRQIFLADSDFGRASCRKSITKNNFSLYYNRANLRLVEDLEHISWW